MQYSKDSIIGAKDQKSRRFALYYYDEKREDTSILQLRNEFKLKIKPAEYFTKSFDIWGTKQIFIFNHPNGFFGQFSLKKIIDNPAEFKDQLQNKIILVGSLHEFSVHVTPSIFNFLGTSESKNISDVFLPANELAANIINTLITGDYIKVTSAILSNLFGITCLILLMLTFFDSNIIRGLFFSFGILISFILVSFLFFS